MIKIILLTLISWSNPKVAGDSLRLETINGKQFVIHQVSEKETLYAISKHYGVSILNILEFNKTADGGLEVGQILKVPYVPKSKVQSANGIVHTVAAKETLFSISKLYDVPLDEIKALNNLSSNSLSLGQKLTIKKQKQADLKEVKPIESQLSKDLHTVAPKETLYSISKQYGIAIGQLKEWNGIVGNELNIGQVLLVAQPKVGVSSTKEKVNPSVSVVPEQPKVVEIPAPKETTIKISESSAGSDEIKEKGSAELIEGTDGNRKYLALYNAAKVGTILKVRNDVNNREVFVRVMGPLPIGSNSKTIIKISKSAFDRLGASEGNFGVEVTYYK
ncbi:MAG: LysM peptidoglycan-binding domain-containing protein [Bacteroidia bacterium]|nr:LysM peptidoglycan-binding domain-containing protein [Bacteroidia bacterium]